MDSPWGRCGMPLCLSLFGPNPTLLCKWAKDEFLFSPLFHFLSLVGGLGRMTLL